MDTEIYISSGILELYCAGALSEAEMREVERMASQFAAVKKEIQAIEDQSKLGFGIILEDEED